MSGEVIRIEDDAEVFSDLLARITAILLHRGFLERTVDPLPLPVRPGVEHLYKAMPDAARPAWLLKYMGRGVLATRPRLANYTRLSAKIVRMRQGTAEIRLRTNLAAILVDPFPCSSAETYLRVRFTATESCSRHSQAPTSAKSMCEYPMGQSPNIFFPALPLSNSGRRPASANTDNHPAATACDGDTEHAALPATAKEPWNADSPAPLEDPQQYPGHAARIPSFRSARASEPAPEEPAGGADPPYPQGSHGEALINDAHEQVRRHLGTCRDAYDFARRLRILRGRTPFEETMNWWRKEPGKFTLEPVYNTLGPNNYLWTGGIPGMFQRL